MLRKFKISIDGTQYLVEDGGGRRPPRRRARGRRAAPAPATPAPAPEAAPAPAPAATSAAPAGSHVQTAAMPGTITNIHVAVGDKVEVNQPVMVLEAMKMENEVVAEVAGTVALHRRREGRHGEPRPGALQHRLAPNHRARQGASRPRGNEPRRRDRPAFAMRIIRGETIGDSNHGS